MRLLLILGLLFGAADAYAMGGKKKKSNEEAAREVFFDIFGTIVDKIGDKAGVDAGDREGEAIMRSLPNGRMLLGKMYLERGGDTDVIRLPRCRNSKNRRVSELRLTVPQAPVRIDGVTVVYQNGDRQRLSVRPRHRSGSNTRWLQLNGRRNGRCIKRIRIDGAKMKGRRFGGNRNKRGVVRVIGR